MRSRQNKEEVDIAKRGCNTLLPGAARTDFEGLEKGAALEKDQVTDMLQTKPRENSQKLATFVDVT